MNQETASSFNSGDSTGSGRTLIAWLAVYFLVSIFLRVTVSSTAEMDETEQLINTQVLRLGYGSQAPLYVWLQHFTFSIMGVNILALSSLKYTLLFSTFACVHAIARKALNDSMGAVLATLSLFLVPQIVWESYRTLTHTVLVTLLAALTMLAILRLRENPSTANYLLLGIAAGLGMLSKYNYIIFLLAVITACVITDAFRKILLSGRIFLSIAAGAAIITGPYLWIVTHLDQASSSSRKLQALDSGSYIIDTAMGFGTLLTAWIGYFWPVLIMYAILYFRFNPLRKVKSDPVIHRLLARTLIVTFLGCTLMIFLFKVSYFKERWMQPLLFYLPVFFMYYLASRLNWERFRIFVLTTVVFAIMAMTLFSGSVLVASTAGRSTRLSPPYKALAAKIQEGGFTSGTIITDDHRIGGNFRLHFKGSPILVTRMLKVPYNVEDQALIVWNADKTRQLPEGLKVYAQELLNTSVDTTSSRYVEASFLYWEGKKMRLGYIIINGPRTNDQSPKGKTGHYVNTS